jgi:molybdopterin-guanine dinucleotide biosynthesis protein A
LNHSADPGFDQTAGFVLAGGQSSRMGSDKALTRLGGTPLIVYALKILQHSGLSVSIAGARSSLSAYAPVIEDLGHGPLSGICNALSSTTARRVVFLSVDMPLIPSSLLDALLHQAHFTDAAVTVPSVSGFAETFPSVVDRALLPALESEQLAGNTGCYAALRSAAARINKPFLVIPVENLVQSGQIEQTGDLPPTFWFLNLNTPSDLARAEVLLTARRVS